MIDSLQRTYAKFPPKFWVLVGTMFIDRIGGTLLQPYIALYITQRFNVGMTVAGVILGIFALSGLAGSFIGGALTDKFGRRSLILFGLIFSALSTLLLGLVNDLRVIYPLGVAIGLLGSIADPAQQAMVADILPEEKRSEGFGMMRVVANLSWIIGPTIGGLMVARSFFSLFVIDAVISAIVAVIFFRLIPESMPQHLVECPQRIPSERR